MLTLGIYLIWHTHTYVPHLTVFKKKKRSKQDEKQIKYYLWTSNKIKIKNYMNAVHDPFKHAKVCTITHHFHISQADC